MQTNEQLHRCTERRARRTRGVSGVIGGVIGGMIGGPGSDFFAACQRRRRLLLPAVDGKSAPESL
jgi:hypothetical protein